MSNLLLWVYQAVLSMGGVGYLVMRLLRGRGVPGWRQRLGWYPKPLAQILRNLRRPIWLHMVSVGEAIAAQPLVEELRRRLPDRDWVFTTVTPTGRSVAQQLIRGPQDQLLYLPWDLAPCIRRAVRAIRPGLFLSFETELWPVLFHRLEQAGVPVVVVNGRISARAYRRYLWVRPWMERALNPVRLFLVQSLMDARRYAAIGAAKDRILVTGNLKWDLKAGDANGAGTDRLKTLLELTDGSILWTAGSTHSGEEGPLLQAYGLLKEKFPGLRLLIAPRHPDRVKEVEGEAQRLGLNSIRRTQLGAGSRVKGEGENPIILLDTVGELAKFYPISDLVFVGGSLVPHGGHNLVEPAAFRRPILTGPHLHNFQSMAEGLMQAGGVVVVKTAKDLEESARRLLENPHLRQQLGDRAYRVIEEHRGATTRTADLILRVISNDADATRGGQGSKGFVGPSGHGVPTLSDVRPSTGSGRTGRTSVPENPAPSGGSGLALSISHFMLGVPEVLYRLGVGGARFLYRTGVLPVHRLPVPVVSVGNLTWGGTGKTPLVMHLAHGLQERGRRVAVLTRGYGKDEATLLSERLEPIPVLVGPDRVASGRRAVREFGANLLLLDDGYQQWRLKKDAEILMLEDAAPFGNGRLIPRGTLREPAEAAQRADLIIVKKTGLYSNGSESIEDRIRRLNPAAPIFFMQYRPAELWRWPRTEEAVPSDYLQGKRICALAGIARPDHFGATLKNLGAELALTHWVRDHHPYTVGELTELFTRCRQKGISFVVTTAKDAVRIPPPLRKMLGSQGKGPELLVLEVALEFTPNESRLYDRIDLLLDRPRD